MNKKVNVSVMIDVENLIDTLISHSNEDDCKHSVDDLLAELFDNKDNFKKLATGPRTQQPNGNLSNDDNHLCQKEIEVK